MILIVAAVVAWAMFNVFASLGDHPLMPPDEGRYARASQVMLETGDWLVPRLDEHPRLQKPPLIYWLQSASMALLGQNEMAARLPSALATIGMIALTFCFAARVGDRMTGFIAALLLGTMPITLIVGRLAIIDPTLSFFWTAAVFAGHLMIHARHDLDQTIHRGWRAAFYLATALAVFAKGPIGMIPLAIVAVYLAASGRGRLIGRIGLWWGIPLAIAPVTAWALSVAWSHPEAWTVWKNQIVNRVTTGSDHKPEAWWFYLPIVGVGMFPATAWLKLPWIHYRWADVRERLRAGEVRGFRGYMVVATLVPLAILSAIAGKMPTYVLPLAPPLALIGAANLRDWLNVKHDHAAIKALDQSQRPRLPDSMLTMAIAATCGWIGVMVFATTPSYVEHVRLYDQAAEQLPGKIAPLIVAPIMIWVAALWWRKAARRTAALTLAAAGLCTIWTWSLMMIEDDILVPTSNRVMYQRLDEATAGRHTFIGFLGLADKTLNFYRDACVPRIEDPLGWTDVPADHDLVILAGAPQWTKYLKSHPGAESRFQRLFVWHKPRKDWIVLRRTDPPQSRKIGKQENRK